MPDRPKAIVYNVRLTASELEALRIHLQRMIYKWSLAREGNQSLFGALDKIQAAKRVPSAKAE